MIIGCIGDIVGKPGREAVAAALPSLKERFDIDFVVANYENASHGFGLTEKNAKELFSYGIDVMTGGNHSFDKKEILTLFGTHPLLRPLNYPEATPGCGVWCGKVHGTNIAVVNLMGHYGMPMADNPFTKIVPTIEKLKSDGIRHIVVDMHAEASAEKQTLLHLLKKDVTVLFGTHTHVGTDDLDIIEGCAYVTDIGLTGCRDGVIGMDKKIPLSRALTGTGGHHDIPKRCKTLFQMIVVETNDDGRAVDAKKIKVYDNGHERIESVFEI